MKKYNSHKKTRPPKKLKKGWLVQREVAESYVLHEGLKLTDNSLFHQQSCIFTLHAVNSFIDIVVDKDAWA